MEETLIPKETYVEIASWISNDESVVGIDAKDTHVLIIHKLLEIERRLKRIEKGLSAK